MLPPNVQAGDRALMLYAPPDVTCTETPAGDVNVTPFTKGGGDTSTETPAGDVNATPFTEEGGDTSTKSASKRNAKSSRMVRLSVIDFFIMITSTVLLAKTRFK